MLPLLFPFIFSTILLCLFLVLIARNSYGSLEGCGFPVIPPSFLFGSVPNIHKEVVQLEQIRQYEKYGPIWGFYHGKEPRVNIADPELVYRILVKDYSNFPFRPEFDGAPSEMLQEIRITGQKSKIVHALLKPALTPTTLAKMTLKFDDDAKELREDIGKKKTLLDVYEISKVWTLNVMLATLFGMDGSETKEILKDLRDAFFEFMLPLPNPGFWFTIKNTFPFIKKFSKGEDHTALRNLQHALEKLVILRRPGGERNDLLDHFRKMWDQIDSKEFQGVGITKATVTWQMVNYLIASDAVAFALTHLLFYVSTTPGCQEKLYEEIKIFEGQEISYEQLQDELVPYLTAVLDETFRLAPSPISIGDDIMCLRDWTYEGYKIKRGVIVNILPMAVNRNPDVYKDPNSFSPDRYLPENRTEYPKYALATFWHGPWACPGTKFAKTIIKVITVRLLLNYFINPTNPAPLEYEAGPTILRFKESPILELVPR